MAKSDNTIVFTYKWLARKGLCRFQHHGKRKAKYHHLFTIVVLLCAYIFTLY